MGNAGSYSGKSSSDVRGEVLLMFGKSFTGVGKSLREVIRGKLWEICGPGSRRKSYSVVRQTGKKFPGEKLLGGKFSGKQFSVQKFLGKSC